MSKNKRFYETDEFAQIQGDWYAKLRLEGFDDIEATDGETIVRPQVFTAHKSKYEGGLEYYEYCQQVLREFPFQRDVDRQVFELHTEGRSYRDIEGWLKKHSTKTLTRNQVGLVIKRIKEDFGRL